MSDEARDKAPEKDPGKDAERLEHEVDEIRAGLEEKVSELARRRHRVAEVTARARQHPWALAAAGAVLIVGAAGVVRWRKQRVRALPARSHGRQQVPGGAGRTVAIRILLAAGTAAASVVARQVARRLLRAGSS